MAGGSWKRLEPTPPSICLDMRGGYGLIVGRPILNAGEAETRDIEACSFLVYGRLAKDARIVSFLSHGMKLYIAQPKVTADTQSSVKSEERKTSGASDITIVNGQTLLWIYGPEQPLSVPFKILHQDRVVKSVNNTFRLSPSDVIAQMFESVLYFHDNSNGKNPTGRLS